MQSGTELPFFEQLKEVALKAGATHISRISPADIVVDNKLATFCREPRCPYFGLSASCPPHVQGPSFFRKELQRSLHGIVIRIEVLSFILHGEQRGEAMRLLHEVTSEVEITAKRLGFCAQGYAGGSCKISFCSDFATCNVVDNKGECRHPKNARQSLSGYGVDVGKLIKSCGWEDTAASSPEEEKKGWIAGLVLLKSQTDS